jgi:drug/metabolite transporter (DMT)-like permease
MLGLWIAGRACVKSPASTVDARINPALLSPFSVLLVLSAAFMHASWNALLRGGADRAQSMLIMNVTVGVIGLAMMAFAGLPSAACAVYVVASGLIHLVYNALLVLMYRSGDLGETYPVARGSSPALVSLGGSLFAGEWMNLIGAAGIGLVCTGIFMLAAARARSTKLQSGSASDRALQKAVGLRAMNLPAALATGASIAAYTVVDGIGVRASGNWIAYTGGVFAFFLAMPLWYLARGRRAMFAVPMAEAGKAASGGAISLLAYGAIIWAMQTSPMGAVSALRETSVVFAALLGAAFLGERLTGLRIAACCIIAAGAACVGWRL